MRLGHHLCDVFLLPMSCPEEASVNPQTCHGLGCMMRLHRRKNWIGAKGTHWAGSRQCRSTMSTLHNLLLLLASKHLFYHSFKKGSRRTGFPEVPVGTYAHMQSHLPRWIKICVLTLCFKIAILSQPLRHLSRALMVLTNTKQEF